MNRKINNFFLSLFSAFSVTSVARRPGSVSFLSDEFGQVTVEWTLLLVAFGLPIVAMSALCLDMIVTHYGLITFIETLPFP